MSQVSYISAHSCDTDVQAGNVSDLVNFAREHLAMDKDFVRVLEGSLSALPTRSSHLGAYSILLADENLSIGDAFEQVGGRSEFFAAHPLEIVAYCRARLDELIAVPNLHMYFLVLDQDAYNERREDDDLFEYDQAVVPAFLGVDKGRVQIGLGDIDHLKVSVVPSPSYERCFVLAA